MSRSNTNPSAVRNYQSTTPLNPPPPVDSKPPSPYPHPLEGGEPTFKPSSDAPPEYRKGPARTDLRLRVSVWILDLKPGHFFILPNSSAARTRGIYVKLARNAAADLGNKVQVEVYPSSEGVVIKRIR